MRLAKAGQRQQAREAFLEGQTKAPLDKRFPIELAGLAYLDKNFDEAKSRLQRALTIDPRDSYTNDFLGTLYYLDQNLEAALKYWNRVEKPRLDDIETRTVEGIDPILLDRAFTFAPASVLRLEEYRTTRARLESLEFFNQYQFRLAGKPGQRFDLQMLAVERRSFPSLSSLRGIAYQAVHLDFHDIRGSGANWTNLLRFDAQKRRLFSELAAPVRGDPQWRAVLTADARRETWNLGTPEDFRMERVEAGAQFRAIPSGRLQWSSGAFLSRRTFANAPGFGEGNALKTRGTLDYLLLSIPERRLNVQSAASAEVGRLMGSEGGGFSRLQTSGNLSWFPQPRGSDYEINARLALGKTLGTPPFDELFILGLERDNDLWLRGHIGTRDGKKGSAPIGRGYVLTNWSLDKNVYQGGFWTVQVGPFLDTGKVSGALPQFGSQKWLVDTGLQSKMRVLGSFTAVVTYGRDLRTGGDSIYFYVLR